MSRIFWDTNLFIYLIEGKDEDQVSSLVQRMKERGDQLYTSTFTLGEALVKPLEASRQDLVERYETTLHPPAVTLVPFDRACARICARLRRDRTIRAADAAELACEAQAGCDPFVTNDERLSPKAGSGRSVHRPAEPASAVRGEPDATM